MKATAETIVLGPGPLPAASAEEVECVLRWLETPGCRMVECDGSWESPAYGAAGRREWLASVGERALTPGAKPERRGMRPTSRPARPDPHKPVSPSGPVGPGRWPAG